MNYTDNILKKYKELISNNGYLFLENLDGGKG